MFFTFVKPVYIIKFLVQDYKLLYL